MYTANDVADNIFGAQVNFPPAIEGREDSSLFTWVVGVDQQTASKITHLSFVSPPTGSFTRKDRVIAWQLDLDGLKLKFSYVMGHDAQSPIEDINAAIKKIKSSVGLPVNVKCVAYWNGAAIFFEN